eukprot:1180215-Prorocentrum_minimum.AAC.3
MVRGRSKEYRTLLATSVFCLAPPGTNNVGWGRRLSLAALYGTSVPVCQCASVPVCQCASAPVRQCASVPVCQCASAPVCQCARAPNPRGCWGFSKRCVAWHLRKGDTKRGLRRGDTLKP